MISDAYVVATCDTCETAEEIPLTALAHRGSYDMRNVKGELKRLGWKDLGDGNLICDSCIEDEEAYGQEDHDPR